MACRRHNYKGSKACEVCGGRDLNMSFEDVSPVLKLLVVVSLTVLAFKYLFISAPLFLMLIWWSSRSSN